jgi:hypothetical protein
MDITLDYIKFGKENERIEYIISDGTKEKSLNFFENIELDLVLDDGSHQVLDQIKTAELFVPKISKKGMFICEDIDHNNLNKITEEFTKIANKNKMKLCIYDLRHIKNRFDDIVAVINY